MAFQFYQSLRTFILIMLVSTPFSIQTVNHPFRRKLTLEECIAPYTYDSFALDIQGDDVATFVTLPFSFPFYCSTYEQIGVSTNGLITMNSLSYDYYNRNIPDSIFPNNFIAPFWDDLITNGKNIYYWNDTEKFILQWTNMGFYGSSIPLGTFQTILYNNGTIRFNYLKLLGSEESYGLYATVGIENIDGTAGLSLSYGTASLTSGKVYDIYPNDNCGYTYSTYISPTPISELVMNTSPSFPTLITPGHRSIISSQGPFLFTWNASRATYYKLFVSSSDNFQSIVVQQTYLLEPSYSVSNGLDIATYYWKIYACNTDGCRESCIYSFTTVFVLDSPPPSPPPPSPPPPVPPSPPPPEPPSPPPPEPPSPPPPVPPSPPPPVPPSPPPPVPPSPPPPVPPSPPPESTFISEEQILVMSQTVSTVVSTAIASSVSAVVSSSVASSVGGSTSIPGANPAALVGMISTVQMMNMKMNMQIGKTPETFKGLAEGVGWVNLDVSIPKTKRRLLLEQKDAFSSAGSLVFYTYVILIPLGIGHFIYQRWKHTQGTILQGILHFPQIESTIALLLVNPYTKNAAQLFRDGRPGAVFAGIGMLLALPIPVLIYSIYAIYRYVILTREVKFVRFEEVHTIKGPFDFLKRAFISTNKGHWKDKHHIMDKYGVFFKYVRGPIYVFSEKEYRWDPEKQKYKWGKVTYIPDRFSTWRSYYKSYFIFRNIFVALLLNAFSYTPTGNMIQLALLTTVSTIHFYFMILASPFNTAKDQFTDISSNICEAGTYIVGIIMIYARRMNFIFLETMSEKALFALQISSIGVHILTQIWAAIIMLIMIAGMLRNKLFQQNQSIIQQSRKHLLLKKYGYKWLYHTFPHIKTHSDKKMDIEEGPIVIYV